jgi:protein-S-isoprenylcysteine O-methyltransferase Ste14
MNKLYSYFLVTLQFGILGMQSYTYGFPYLSIEPLLLIPIIIATVLTLWTFLHLKPGKFNITPELKDDSLWVSSGPFKFIRHPMYTALLIFSLHYLLIDIAKFFLYWAGLFFVLSIKAIKEEKSLKQKFLIPSSYFKSTGRFFPKF